MRHQGEDKARLDPDVASPALDRSTLSRLVLTGFMGAGKSTVGAILAQITGWRFLDLDAVIEASAGHSIADIFRDHGEIVFRDRERQALEQSIQNNGVVLALGGGTMENESSRSLLMDAPGTCLVFLEGQLDDLIARCAAEGKARPLLAAPEIMAVRHARRLPFYRMAHVTIQTTGMTPQQVATQVMERVGAQWSLVEAKVGMHGSH